MIRHVIIFQTICCFKCFIMTGKILIEIVLKDNDAQSSSSKIFMGIRTKK